MRFALTVEGSRGDVHPMLDLGDRLVARGHEVVVCAPPDAREAVEARGMELRPVGFDVHDGLAANANALLAGGLRGMRVGYAWFRATACDQLARLPELTRDVDRIIGAAIQLGAASAAELNGIPYRYVIFCPALLPSDEHPPITIATQTLPRWLNALAWQSFLIGNELVLRRLLNRKRAALGLRALDDVNRYVLGERPIVAVDRELARVPEDCPVDTEQIDCLHAMTGPPLPPKLEAFLAQGPPPVYIGFGSMPDTSPANSTRILLEAIRITGCRALISEGWAGLGAGPRRSAHRCGSRRGSSASTGARSTRRARCTPEISSPRRPRGSSFPSRGTSSGTCARRRSSGSRAPARNSGGVGRRLRSEEVIDRVRGGFAVGAAAVANLGGAGVEPLVV
jgi:UDP:flavonoid glycosyltransferase YjiC (YdhE family)